ncbi:hypothetical protein EDB87DRAFT_1689686 [Lactarius vividus]|nr:hypothetical protein EDB87DRAFT_1689686 [Lactarius vividus]
MPKLYLDTCSPVLRKLIRSDSITPDVPSGKLEEQERLPVVKLQESKATLYNLFTFIFPVVPILPSTTERIMELLADPPFLRPETALRVYFLAQEHELHQEALQAARVTLRLPMIVEDLGDKLEFPGTTGTYLLELWKYHQRVRTDLKLGVSELKTSGLSNIVKTLRCGRNQYNTFGYHISDSYPRWIDDYIGSITEAPHLFDLIEFESAWARHIQDNSYTSSKCSCVGISSQIIRAFWEALTAAVHRTIAKADSTLALVKEEPTSANSDPPSVPLCLDIPDASIIIRSSDQATFRVHKSVLAMSSPFFKDLLSLPQPPDDELVDGLPVIQLSEDAGLLNSLISLLYPITHVIPSSYEKVFALLASCQKYDMESVQYHIRAEIKHGRFPAPGKAEGFSACAIAGSLGLDPELEDASRLTVGSPMTFESLGEQLRSFKGRSLGIVEPNEVTSNDLETLIFDHPGSPDIVLLSSDSCEFRVPKLYIATCSPVLRELIQNASNTPDVRDGEQQESLPVVKLQEGKTTLYNLLTFIFPAAPVLPSSTEKIMELLAVSQKYQMESVMTHIRGAIARQDPPFIRPETALHVYLLAQQHGLHPEALQAARVTLRLPMVLEDLDDKLEYSPEMTGAYLHELWKYHQRVQADLKSNVLEFRNSGLPDVVRDLRCSVPRSSSLPQWLDGYIGSIAEALPLFDLIEFENTRALHIKSSFYHPRSCSCIDISSHVIRSFWEALTTVVHGTIEKTDSTLTLVKEEPTPENSESDPPSMPSFLDIADANSIVRSSDKVNLRVHKSVLAMSSPFFKDLLSLPQPPDDHLVDGLPVIQLSEDADLLNSLISLLYPVSPIIPGSYEKVFALLAACQKYDMESVQSNIRDGIKLGRFPAPVEAEAFRAYAIAGSLGLSPELENAAHLTLRYPMTFESLGEQLRSFKGRALTAVASCNSAPNEVISYKALHFDYLGSHVVLRSCDSHDLRVFQFYLVNSSPVLRELIRTVSNTPRIANGEEQEPFLVVKLSESGDPPLILPETALYVYFFVQKYELHQLALLAARSTLRFSMTIEHLEDRIDFMPGVYLREFWKYHKNIVNDLRCGTPSSSTSNSIPQWLDDYIEFLAQAPRLFDLIEFENALPHHIRDLPPRSETMYMYGNT